MVPGSYFLTTDHQPSGNANVAAQWTPFTIRNGEVTKIAVQVRRGQPQPFDLHLPLDATNVHHIRLTIKGSNGIASDINRPVRPGDPTRLTLALAPDRYAVTATTTAGHRASAQFHVRQDVAGKPQQLTLQKPR